MGGKLSSEARRLTAANWANQLEFGELSLYEGGISGLRIVRFTGLVVSGDNAGKLIISDAGGTTEAATQTPSGVDSFALRTSGGTIWASGENRTITVGSANQMIPDDTTFQISNHELVNNQTVSGNGVFPPTTETVDWGSLLVQFVNINQFRLLKEPKGEPIQMAGTSPSFSLSTRPLAVGDENSNALIRLLKPGTTYDIDTNISFAGFSISAPHALF